MQLGTVKFYNSERGFGFIQPDDGGKDVFIHATALERAGTHILSEGQKVTFDIQEDRRSGKISVSNIPHRLIVWSGVGSFAASPSRE
jgi:CspA family cold shock protein